LQVGELRRGDQAGLMLGGRQGHPYLAHQPPLVGF